MADVSLGVTGVFGSLVAVVSCGGFFCAFGLGGGFALTTFFGRTVASFAEVGFATNDGVALGGGVDFSIVSGTFESVAG